MTNSNINDDELNAWLNIFDDLSGVTDNPDDATKQFYDIFASNLKQDIKLRKHFSYATFALVAAWLLFVSYFLLYSKNEPSVLIAVVTGTTIKVLGLYYIVLRYIFPKTSARG